MLANLTNLAFFAKFALFVKFVAFRIPPLLLAAQSKTQWQSVVKSSLSPNSPFSSNSPLSGYPPLLLAPSNLSLCDEMS